MSKTTRDDLIDIIEQIVSATESAGDRTVVLNTGMVRQLLELAKRAPKPRGRPQVKGRAKLQENVVLRTARKKEKVLLAGGMRKGVARKEVTEEAAAKLRSRNLSAPTMKRRLEKPFK